MQRVGSNIWILVLFAICIGGCAFTQGNLNLAYTDAQAKKGPLASIRPLHVEIGEFVDVRRQTDKIGYKTNLYGMKTANIVTTRPVPEIVREAFAAEFAKNGHLIGSSSKEIMVSGRITAFWFDVQLGFWTVQFMGTVSVDLTVTNNQIGLALLTRTYQGHYNETSTGGLEGTWERIMNTALERMIQETSTDPKLIEALKSL